MKEKPNQKIYKGIYFDIPMKKRGALSGEKRVEEKMKKPLSARYPRLDTVLEVEKFIKEHDGEYKKKQMWKNLPKKIMYPTFNLIIDYLLVSGKISVDSEGKIGWIFYPEEAEKRLEQAHLRWRKNQ